MPVENITISVTEYTVLVKPEINEVQTEVITVPSEDAGEQITAIQVGTVGPPGAQGEQGIQGIPGPEGPVGGTGYDQVFTNQVEVLVNHNLGRYPMTLILDSGGLEVEAEVLNLNTNQLRVYFTIPYSGFIRCV